LPCKTRWFWDMLALLADHICCHALCSCTWYLRMPLSKSTACCPGPGVVVPAELNAFLAPSSGFIGVATGWTRGQKATRHDGNPDCPGHTTLFGFRHAMRKIQSYRWPGAMKGRWFDPGPFFCLCFSLKEGASEPRGIQHRELPATWRLGTPFDADACDGKRGAAYEEIFGKVGAPVRFGAPPAAVILFVAGGVFCRCWNWVAGSLFRTHFSD